MAATIEQDRAKRQHADAGHPCRVCGGACNGYPSRNGRAVLCLHRKSKTPDTLAFGYWHLLGRVCTCGEMHRAQA